MSAYKGGKKDRLSNVSIHYDATPRNRDEGTEVHNSLLMVLHTPKNSQKENRGLFRTTASLLQHRAALSARAVTLLRECPGLFQGTVLARGRANCWETA